MDTYGQAAKLDYYERIHLKDAEYPTSPDDQDASRAIQMLKEYTTSAYSCSAAGLDWAAKFELKEGQAQDWNVHKVSILW